MTVPSPRNAILPARGDFNDLVAAISSLKNGELCYAVDRDILYVNESGTLVPTGGSSLANLSDVNLASLADGDALVYDGNVWSNGGNLNGGAF
jgi:hypothetical protein